MSGDEMPTLGGPVPEPSAKSQLLAAVSHTGMSSDEAYYLFDLHDLEVARKNTLELRKLAAQYKVFRSERMWLIAEGLELAADLLAPEEGR